MYTWAQPNVEQIVARAARCAHHRCTDLPPLWSTRACELLFRGARPSSARRGAWRVSRVAWRVPGAAPCELRDIAGDNIIPAAEASPRRFLGALARHRGTPFSGVMPCRVRVFACRIYYLQQVLLQISTPGPVADIFYETDTWARPHVAQNLIAARAARRAHHRCADPDPDPLPVLPRL